MENIQRVNDLHHQAMASAEQAFIAKWRGELEIALVHFRRAYELEAEAARLVVYTEPTRSILLRSAASLAYHCGEMRESEKLIGLALAGDPPSEIAEELRDLMRLVLDALREKAAGD
jgi:hypothetical protein